MMKRLVSDKAVLLSQNRYSYLQSLYVLIYIEYIHKKVLSLGDIGYLNVSQGIYKQMMALDISKVKQVHN